MERSPTKLVQRGGGRLLSAFESWEIETDPERRRAWLGQFAAGGGLLARLLMI
jgi:hypothetical protein